MRIGYERNKDVSPRRHGGRRDRAVKRYETDLLIDRERFPARTGAEIFGAIAEIQAKIAVLELTLLVLYGTAGELTSVAGSQNLSDE